MATKTANINVKNCSVYIHCVRMNLLLRHIRLQKSVIL